MNAVVDEAFSKQPQLQNLADVTWDKHGVGVETRQQVFAAAIGLVR